MSELPTPVNSMTLAEIQADHEQVYNLLEQGGAMRVYTDEDHFLGVLTHDPACGTPPTSACSSRTGTSRRSTSSSGWPTAARSPASAAERRAGPVKAGAPRMGTPQA